MPDNPLGIEARVVRQLPGLSGAHVLLMTKDNRHWFVRKIASDPSGSARLARQIQKQLAFVRAMGAVVRAPVILDQGEIEGRAYFDMDFVRGADGATFLRRASKEEVVEFANTLSGYVEAVAACPAHQIGAASLFDALFGKLCEVQRKTKTLDSDTLARLYTSLERVQAASSSISATLCHGDLTLENLIVDDQRQLWVIDLLDAPYEHYWHDVAKLHQDLEGGWYMRGQPAISRYVLEYVSRRVMETAVRLEPMYAEVHGIMLACTFIRILPYVKDERERAFVMQRVGHFARLASGET